MAIVKVLRLAEAYVFEKQNEGQWVWWKWESCKKKKSREVGIMDSGSQRYEEFGDFAFQV